MSERRTRVLIVDDSAFARKVLRDVLNRAADVEVVGSATDGLHALEQVSLLSPDVITLDLVMPNLDGLGFLKALPRPSAPRVLIVTRSGSQSDLVLAALEAGAVDVVEKPTALATEQLYELGGELIAKVRAAANASTREGPTRERQPLPAVKRKRSSKLVVIGTSTGGPQALTRLMRSLPEDFPAAMAIVLHIPVGYTKAVAARLDEVCALDVVEAEEGLELKPGRVVLARAGEHLRVRRDGDRWVAALSTDPLATPHRPSVDVLFHSAAEVAGEDAVGVVLTGMGEDGLAGARSIHAAGGVVLAENRSTCVVYGMPRAVTEAQLSAEQPGIDEIAAALVRRV